MRNLYNKTHFAKPRRKEDETVVQNDLSYTPSQMYDMMERGIPISPQNVNPDNFFDGVPITEGTFDLPIDRLRGVDIADCWNATVDAQKTARKGLKDDIKQFGAWKPAPEQKGE